MKNILWHELEAFEEFEDWLSTEKTDNQVEKSRERETSNGMDASEKYQ